MKRSDDSNFSDHGKFDEIHSSMVNISLRHLSSIHPCMNGILTVYKWHKLVEME